MRSKQDSLFVSRDISDMLIKVAEPFREKSMPGDFYEEPSADSARPGIYYINLSNMTDRPCYEIEPLVCRAGIPGHHMQISTAKHLKDIPEFRKSGFHATCIAGWELYTEYVAKEAGLFHDPYADFGVLSHELFMAALMGVDVGIHDKKWTRRQALDYLLKNTPEPEGVCRKEIDRCIVFPAEVIASKTVMLKILNLREKAKRELGDRFDLRAFHAVILSNGPLPLNLLSGVIQEWIEKQKANPARQHTVN